MPTPQAKRPISSCFCSLFIGQFLHGQRRFSIHAKRIDEAERCFFVHRELQVADDGLTGLLLVQPSQPPSAR